MNVRGLLCALVLLVMPALASASVQAIVKKNVASISGGKASLTMIGPGC